MSATYQKARNARKIPFAAQLMEDCQMMKAEPSPRGKQGREKFNRFDRLKNAARDGWHETRPLSAE